MTETERALYEGVLREVNEIETCHREGLSRVLKLRIALQEYWQEVVKPGGVSDD